jgi:small subunit ribosomal protein S16
MVRIRLRRVGARNQPSYRIVAADKESPRDGRFLENLGHYNPRTEPSTVVVDEARLFHWLQHGAQPSDAVRKILNSYGTWDRWERFKGGEDLDTLLEEAEESKIDVDPRTRRDDLFSERAEKSAARKEKATKATEVKEEPVEEVETEEEPAVSETAEDTEPEVAETPEDPEPEEEEVEEVSQESAEEDKPEAEEEETEEETEEGPEAAEEEDSEE